MFVLLNFSSYFFRFLLAILWDIKINYLRSNASIEISIAIMGNKNSLRLLRMKITDETISTNKQLSIRQKNLLKSKFNQAKVCQLGILF